MEARREHKFSAQAAEKLRVEVDEVRRKLVRASNLTQKNTSDVNADIAEGEEDAHTIQNLEYLKNVVFKFLAAANDSKQQQKNCKLQQRRQQMFTF